MAELFPKDFLFGTATASYQVEGAVDSDGRGASIWDTFSHTPGKTVFGHNGDTAVDQFHRYKEDVQLMTSLGIGAYRFSLSWPRIQPEGKGQYNPKGMDYYLRLIEELKKNNIEPVITLYHWDLPQVLQDSGGWPERDTAYRFAEYAAHCFDTLSPFVNRWITLNEPLCSSIYSYQDGVHAPGIKNRTAAYYALHTLNIAHGLAVREFRQGGYKGEIGISHNLSTPRPYRNTQEDNLAADRAADRNSRMFLNPMFGKEYPVRHIEAFPDVSMPVKPGDFDIISSPVDFLGINYYFEQAVKFDRDAPEQFSFVETSLDKTDMGWDIVPEGLTRMLMWTVGEYGNYPIYVTENGCAMRDTIIDGVCSDPGRIAYLKDHLMACIKAIAGGVNLKGYFLWSYIDNFEWAYGYTKRFGIVYCDTSNLERIPKESFHYYKKIIRQREI